MRETQVSSSLDASARFTQPSCKHCDHSLILCRESDYFTERGEFRVDSEGSPTLLNCLMYKLSYYRFGELKFDYNMPAGFDR